MRRILASKSPSGSLLAAASTALLLAGCSGTSNPDRPQFDATDIARDREFLDARIPGSDVIPMDDVQSTDANDADAPMDVFVPTTVRLRIGNFTPNPSGALPNFDICLRTAGSSDAFANPLLENHGLAAGVAWNELSAYFETMPGMYDLLIVDGSTNDCSRPLATPQTNVTFPAAGNYASVIVAGLPAVADAGMAVTMRATVINDRNPTTMPPTANPAIRLFHAVPSAGLNVDVGIVIPGPPDIFSTVFEAVTFGNIGRGPMGGMGTDVNGYYAAPPAMGLTIGLRNTCMGISMCTNPILLRVEGLTTTAGSLSTGFLTLRPHPTLPGQTVSGAIICIDTAPPVAGLAQCLAP